MKKQGKCKGRPKFSPYLIQTALVNEWKTNLGLSDVKIANKIGFDPSTVSRNIANGSKSARVQRAVAALLAKLSGGEMSESDFLIVVRPTPSAQGVTKKAA
jgi:hypothetical protein